jgi:hypothetical protein
MKKLIIGAVICLLSTDCKIPEAHDTLHFELDGGSYPAMVEVIITSDIQSASEYIRNTIDSTVVVDDFEASAGMTFNSEDGGHIVIWLEKASLNPEDISVINHELMHAVASTMYYAGVSFTDSSEEAYAYQLQHYSNQFYNKIK